MTELWTWQAVLAATGGETVGLPDRPITGVSIDTRTLQPGDMFVALKDQRDGHEFVAAAFAVGATCALVEADWARSQNGEVGALVCVDDTLAALQHLGSRPDGYCFCFGDTPSGDHTGECREAQQAIARTEAERKSPLHPYDVELPESDTK